MWLLVASRQSVVVGGEIYGVHILRCVSAHAWGDGDGLVGQAHHTLHLHCISERERERLHLHACKL